MMLWGFVALVVLSVPFMREWVRKPMNDAHRRDAPGRFAALSQGVTHYDWIGPEVGPVALCIHGQTTPSFVYRAMADDLVEMGFRVLIFDLYGRGYSDRPRGLQDAAFFNRQIEDLLADQGVDEDLTVIGYSMGGAVAAAFAAKNPATIRQMVLLAAAGTAPVMSSKMRRLIGVPVLGDWVIQALYPRILCKGIEAERGLPMSIADMGDRQLRELRYQGFMPAVISSLRGVLARPRTTDHRRIADAGLPVLAIWGGADELIGKTAREGLSTLNPKATQEVVDEAGHGLPYTHTAEVLEVLQGWIEGRS